MNTRRQFLIHAPLGILSRQAAATFNPPRRVPHGVPLIGRLFEDGVVGVDFALEKAFAVTGENPPRF
jgi:hypothetical protein